MIDFSCQAAKGDGGVHSCAFYAIFRSTGCDLQRINIEVGGAKNRGGAQPPLRPLTLTTGSSSSKEHILFTRTVAVLAVVIVNQRNNRLFYQDHKSASTETTSTNQRRHSRLDRSRDTAPRQPQSAAKTL